MKYILFGVLLLAARYTYAQESCTLTLTGKVIDEHDASSLGYADIWAKQAGVSTISDASGAFEISGLCPGPLALRVAHVGCDTLDVAFMIRRDTSIQLFMEHHTELLEIVQIEAAKPHEDIMARQTLSKQKVERMQAMSYAELLDDELGVQMNQTGGNIAKPMLHGLSGNRVALRDNGVILEGQQWGSEHAPEIDPFAMEEVEVVYGASSLRYGPEALAGAIVSKRKTETIRALNGWVHMNGASNGRSGNGSVMLRGAPIKSLPLFAFVQGTVGRSGDLSAPKYVLDNTGTSNLHGQVGLTYVSERFGAHAEYRRFNTQLGILSFAHVGNLTDLRNAIELERPATATNDFSYSIEAPYQNVEHEVSAAELWWRPQLETKLELSFNRQYNLRQEFDNSIFALNGADLQYELTTHSGELRLDHRFNTVFKTEFGLIGQRQANTYTGRFFIPNFLAYEGGAYLIQHLTLQEQEVEVGVRYDVRQQQAFMYRMDTLYRPERNFAGLSWNVGYGIDKGVWSLSTNVAQGWRPPAINELYSNGLHHGAAAVEVGDELLDEERSFSWMNQFEVRDLYYGGLRWSFMVRGHASYYDQFIYLVPTGTPALTIRGAYPTFEYRGVDAVLAGVDASLAARFGGRWSGALGVEMVRAQEWSIKRPLIFMPADRADLEVRYALDLFNEGRYIAVTATGVNEQFRVPGIDYAPPPPTYFLLASELGWAFRLNSDFRVITALRVSNILNTSYRSYTNRLRYFADEMGRNFSLVIRVPFDFSPKQEHI